MHCACAGCTFSRPVFTAAAPSVGRVYVEAGGGSGEALDFTGLWHPLLVNTGAGKEVSGECCWCRWHCHSVPLVTFWLQSVPHPLPSLFISLSAPSTPSTPSIQSHTQGTQAYLARAHHVCLEMQNTAMFAVCLLNAVRPNSLCLGCAPGAPGALLLTGPNMGGKSTLLRATCVATIMAHMGCYVPAERAVLAPVDRIFTRMGEDQGGHCKGTYGLGFGN